MSGATCGGGLGFVVWAEGVQVLGGPSPRAAAAFPCLQLKPMNCPFHISVYKQGYYSYRDLPIRWAELGTGKGPSPAWFNASPFLWWAG